MSVMADGMRVVRTGHAFGRPPMRRSSSATCSFTRSSSASMLSRVSLTSAPHRLPPESARDVSDWGRSGLWPGYASDEVRSAECAHLHLSGFARTLLGGERFPCPGSNDPVND